MVALRRTGRRQRADENISLSYRNLGQAADRARLQPAQKFGAEIMIR